MRTYPHNSPEAAARVVAMALLADGHCSMTEIRAIDRLDAARRLGLSPDQFHEVLDSFCHDLFTSQHSCWVGSSHIDPQLRSQLVNEITHPQIQDDVLALCAAVVKADGHVGDEELSMLDHLADVWCRGGPVEGIRTSAPGSYRLN